jgi:hypothetical protein
VTGFDDHGRKSRGRPGARETTPSEQDSPAEGIPYSFDNPPFDSPELG